MVPAMRRVGCLFWMLFFFARFVAPARYLNESTQLHLQLQLPEKHVALFVFGDSLYDPGNNNFLNISILEKGNYPPYGETFFHFPTGRRSDGRVVPDFIAMYANLPMWKPYLEPGEQGYINGANFASSGACVLADNYAGPLTLGMQLSYFKDVVSSLRQQLGDAGAEKLLRNAVYLSSIGGVDYFMFMGKYPNATQTVKQEYINWVVGNITDAVKEIYNVGGRKFAFQNAPPMGCWPKTKQAYNLSIDDCLDELLELPLLHKEALAITAKELEMELPGFQYLTFDYYNALYDRIINPLEYGFKEAGVACCGGGLYRGSNCGVGEYDLCDNPDEYLFFDSVHPTEHGHSQLAEILWYGQPNITAPLSMRQLFELEPEIETFEQDDGASAEE